MSRKRLTSQLNIRSSMANHEWRWGDFPLPRKEKGVANFKCGCPKTEDNTYVEKNGKTRCLWHKRYWARIYAREQRA